jgi:hypothetical protein
MFGVFLMFFFMGALIFIVRLVQESEDKNPVMAILLAGYFLRLLIRAFNRDLAIYSEGQTLGGGDAMIYEYRASLLAALWQRTGIHFTTSQEVPELNQVPLPPNLFGFVEYFSGDYSAIGNVSIVAFLACMTALVLYRTYIVYDLERKTSLYAMCFLFLAPSFMGLTSDAFKDGILVFLTVCIFSILIHIGRNNYYWMFPLLVLCFWGLDGTRFYLIYALLVPTVIRFLGFQKQSLLGFGTAFMFAFGLLMLFGNLTVLYSYVDDASDVFENSYALGSQVSNMSGGSGVDIDGGRPTLESLPIKIVYTLLAPFPWQSGSLGLHLSKIEMLLWYFILYWAYRGVRFYLSRDPMMVFMFSAFIIGMTVVYAWSFTNIGLMYRQRLPIFFVASILAVWGRVAAKQKT